MGKLVDVHGNPLEAAVTAGEVQTASMVHLHSAYGEHPSNGLTPPRLALILREAESGNIQAQCDLFQDMEEKDAHLLAEMGKRRRALTTVSWSVVPARNATAAEKAEAQWLQEVLEDIPDFEDLLFDMMDAVGKGFSAHEIEWGMIGKKWLPRRLHYREPNWFCLDSATRTELLLRDGTGGTPLTPFGWMVHTHKAKSGYLSRAGLYRTLAWPFLFKNYSVRDMAEFLEVYGIPLRLGTFHKGATEEEKRVLMRAVMSIGHSASGVIPEGMAIDFKEAAKGTHLPFDWMVNWCEKSMSKAILGGTLTSQADGKSSTHALGAVHNEVRHDLLRSDARQVAETLRMYLMWPLLTLNFGGERDPSRMPKIVFDVFEEADFRAYADSVPALVNAGLEIPKSWVYEKLRIPAPVKGDDVLRASPTAAPAAARQSQAAAKAAVPASGTEQDDVPSSLAIQLADDWVPVEEMIASPLQSLMAECRTAEELQSRLHEVIEQGDTDALVELIAQGLFVARAAGNVGE